MGHPRHFFCCFDAQTNVTEISIAAGQNTTFFLARPNDKLSDLPRHPADLDTPQECIVCSQDNGDDDSPLECDKVPVPLVSRFRGITLTPACRFSATLRITWGV